MTPRTWQSAVASIEWPVVGVLLVLHAAFAWIVRVPGITTGNDDAAYLMLAEQLLQGRYHDWFLPGAPPHGQYPPGFPAFLAVPMAAVGRNFDVLVGMNIAVSTAALALFHGLIRKRLSPLVALASLSATALNASMIEQAGSIASEPLFMLAVGISLALLDRSTGSVAASRLAALAAGGATWIRSAGAPLFLAQAAHWLFRREPRRALLATLIGGLPVIAWFAWSKYAGRHSLAMTYWSGENAAGPDPISRGVIATLQRIGSNAYTYVAHEMPSLLDLPITTATAADNLGWLAISIMALATGALVLARRWTGALWYLLAYGGLLLIWTWPLERFLQPILPLLLATMFCGLAASTQRFPVAGRIGIAVLLSGLAVGSVMHVGSRVAFATSCERAPLPTVSSCYLPRQQGFFAALLSAARRADTGDALVTGKYLAAAYVTGLRSVPAHHCATSDGDQLLQELERLNARFVVSAHLQPSDARLAARLLGICDQLTLLERHAGDTLLLEVRADSSGAACRALSARLPESVAMAQPVPW